MKTTATRVTLFVLAIASFAPVAIGLRPGRWAAYYYGALFVWWVLMSVVTVRQAPGRPVAAARHRDRRDGRKVRPASATGSTNTRLIIVADERVDLHSRFRRKHPGDEAVRIITDRRGTDRRRHLEVYIPERRRAERRRLDIQAQLRTRGWAEVRVPES
jgi:hypothetical protein